MYVALSIDPAVGDIVITPVDDLVGASTRIQNHRCLSGILRKSVEQVNITIILQNKSRSFKKYILCSFLGQ